VEERETPAGERVTGDPTGVHAEEAPGLARGKRVFWNEDSLIFRVALFLK
jgi:hypothetical protein